MPGGLPARCIFAHEESIIAGNDGGYVSLISAANGSLELKTCLSKFEGKVLCLTVDSTKHDVVAAGDSTGKVHILDLKSGSTLSTYSVGNEHSTRPPIVWALSFAG